MQITRTKKALIAVIALVLVGLLVALAAVYLPSGESSLPSKDSVIADTGSGADTVSTVSSSATAPLEDGLVPDGYQPSGTGISDIDTARGDLDGSYYLTKDITINTLAVADNADDVNVFTGVFDGNGHKITIDAVSSANIANGSKGGLFAILQGTVKNCVIEVVNFQAKFASGSKWAGAGIIAGSGGGENTVVENVRIVLKHSPDNMTNGSDNAYLSQSASAAQGASLRLGGVFGNVIGNVTINDTTVDNQTTGNYGFSTKDWRDGGNFFTHSDGFAYIGGFFGRIQSGNISAARLTLAGTSSSKIHAYSESTTNYRYNQSFVGGILGYADEGKIDINGLIITYPVNNNLGYTNANYDQACGIINGWADDAFPPSVTNAYIVSGAESAYNQSNGASATVSYNTFASSVTPRFVGTSEIAFNGFTKQAPSNASAIVAEITQGGTTQNVMQALIATNESEAGQSVWLTVPYVNTTSTAAINLATSYATGSTVTLSSDLTFSSGEGIYMSSKEYDGNNVSASIVLGDGKTDLTYSELNANKNVGTHTLTSNINSASGYAYIDYAGTKYVYNTANKTIYTPQQVAGAAFDVTKALSVEITQRAITLGKANGNVTYGDELATVQSNNIPAATQGSFVSGEYVESCVITDYVQFETNAGSEETFAYTSVVVKDAGGADVTANYNVTFGEGKAVVQQKLIEGTLSVEDLVYSAVEKTAAFSLTNGELYNEDAVSISYSGDQVNVTAEGFVATATVPSANYTFGGDYGASFSRTFNILPYKVTITAKEDRPASHVYNSGVVSADDLFDVPSGLLADEELALTLSATKDGEAATVELVGKYVITANLAADQPNYTADPVSVDYEVTPYVVSIGINESATVSKVYDGIALTEDEMKALFVAPKMVEGAEFPLSVSVEGAAVNEGVYTVTATVESLDATRYALEKDVTAQFTINKVVIDGSIVAPEDSVYDGSEKFATFEITDEGQMVGDDEIIITYATQGGQGVTQVVSAGTYTVSAALPAYEAGKSNYQWANEEIATKDIVISKAPVTITANSATAEKQFDGVAFDDYASLFTAPNGVNGEGALALTYVVGGAAENILNAGVYTVTATLENNAINANYEASEAVVTYTVTPVTVELVWSANDYTYDGSVQTVSATYNDINAGPVALAVSFGEGVEFWNAGEYTATASFAEGDNEYGNYVLPEIVTNTYNIKKADSVIDTEGVVTVYTYTGALQTVESGATLNHGEAELVYSNNTFTTVAEGNGKEVVISVADTANYNGASTTVQITVNKATPEVTATVEPTEGLFTSSEMPAIGTDCAVEGTIAWDAEQTLTEGTNDYTWTFIPNDTANYNTVTGKVQLTVSAVALDRIEVKTQPSKVTYEYGDKFDKTGMIVEAVYNDGSRVAVEEYTYADAYLTTLGANQITIAYDGKETTVEVEVEAKAFEMAYSDLTVVAGTADFDIASITASIADTDGSNVTVAGQSYAYTVEVAYADAQYDAGAEVGTEYPLTVTVTVTDLDAQYYVGTYEATLKVIATSMEGSWISESVTAEYDGASHAAEFNKTVGGEFEIQYAVSGTDVWSTEAPVNAGEYVAKVVSLDNGYSADRLPTATVTINKKSVTITANSVENGVYDGTAFADYASLFNAPSGVNDEGALELAFTVTKDGVPVDEIKDAGTYKVVAKLANENGNYTATECEATYTVSPAEVTVNWTGENSVVYSGTAYEPAFEATGLFGGDQLNVTYQTTDGTLTDGKARNAGSYTATAVLPNANYVFASDAVTTFDFAIEKVKVSFSALLDGNTKYVEYGGTYEPSVNDFYTTSVDNSELFEFYIRWSLEFDLSGIATANAGTKYEAAVEGVVRYAGGEDIAEADYSNFELTGDIADIVVYVEVIAKKINVTATDASATYDGEKVSVDELLAMFGLGDIDANVTVNDKAYDEADITDVGSYNVVVASADENYEFIGDTDATFTVNAADMTAVTVTGYSGEYDKTAHGAVVNASATTVDGSVVTFVYATEQNGVYGDAPEFTYAGEYTVWYKATAANHNEAAGSFTVTIAKAVVDLPEIASKAYNGETQTATVAESDLYTVTTNDGGINAGNYYVEIELNDKDNYAWVSDEDGDGVIEAEWSIVKATPTVNPVVPETVFRGTRLRNISIELGEGDTPGTIEWKNPNYVLEADENVCDWIFTPTDTDNYDTLEGSVTLIGKYVIVTHIEILQTPDKLVYEYGDELDITGLRARTVYNNGATGIIDNSDMYLTFSPTKMTQLGTVTVTIKYHSYTEKFDVTVNKKEISVNWTGADSAVYSGEAYEPAFENTALIGEDKMSVTYEATTGALTEGKAVNAGSYTATAVLPSENYVFADDTASTFDFTIDTVKISATFVGSNVDVVYGGVYGWNIADFYKDATIVNSDDFTVEFGFASSDDLSAISTADKGTVFNASLAVIIKNKAGETVPDEDPNFEVVDGESYSMDLTVTVIAKKINLTATDASAVYDGEKVAKSELLAMFGLSEDTGVVVKVGGVAYDDAAIANAGEYVVTVEEANANYEVTGETSAKYVVTAKQLTVVWGALSFEYDGEEKLPTATVDTGIDGESVEIIVSGAATELGKYTATASMKDVNPNYTLVNTQAQFEIVRTAIVAQFTVGYGEITVVSENDDAIEYSVNDGAWTVLPEDGKIEVELAASWTIKLRYVGATVETEHVIYTTANNVALYLEANLSEEALENKAVIDTAKSWLATAVGDKTDAEAMIAEAENKYNAAKDTLADSVENAFKATANVTGRTVTAIVALSTAVTGLGLAAGIIAIRRKGGKKNENK